MMSLRDSFAAKKVCMMKKSLLLLPLLALTACATPREQCISDVTRNVATLDRLIAVTRGNLDRGFAIDKVQDVRVIRQTCTRRASDGTRYRVRCDRTATFNRNVPRTINLDEERIKLRQLEQRRQSAGRDVQQGINQCIAIHPE